VTPGETVHVRDSHGQRRAGRFIPWPHTHSRRRWTSTYAVRSRCVAVTRCASRARLLERAIRVKSGAFACSLRFCSRTSVPWSRSVLITLYRRAKFCAWQCSVGCEQWWRHGGVAVLTLRSGRVSQHIFSHRALDSSCTHMRTVTSRCVRAPLWMLCKDYKQIWYCGYGDTEARTVGAAPRDAVRDAAPVHQGHARVHGSCPKQVAQHPRHRHGARHGRWAPRRSRSLSRRC
jgi:hypothetical protein